MEKQNRLRCHAPAGQWPLKPALFLPAGSSVPALPLQVLSRRLLATLAALAAPALAAGPENAGEIVELRRRLADREVEVAALQAEIYRLRARVAATQPPASRAVPAGSAPSPAREGQGSPPADDDELARALESSLVRQGGSVLRPGTVELEPELSYFYDEPAGNRRRDSFSLALTGRLGLPDSMQAEVRLPYVAHDRWSGTGTSSGPGDVRLGLTRELLPGGEATPSLLAFAQWRLPTGEIDRTPPTGYGQHALQLGFSTVRRQDPVVLFGSLSYTWNLGEAHLRHGLRYDAGDFVGGRLGAYLAATPDTSLYLGLSFNSNMADRLNGNPLRESGRLSGMVDFGTTTIIGPGRFMTVSGGIGVTAAAPKFSLAVSFPIRF